MLFKRTMWMWTLVGVMLTSPSAFSGEKVKAENCDGVPRVDEIFNNIRKTPHLAVAGGLVDIEGLGATGVQPDYRVHRLIDNQSDTNKIDGFSILKGERTLKAYDVFSTQAVQVGCVVNLIAPSDSGAARSYKMTIQPDLSTDKKVLLMLIPPTPTSLAAFMTIDLKEKSLTWSENSLIDSISNCGYSYGTANTIFQWVWGSGEVEDPGISPHLLALRIQAMNEKLAGKDKCPRTMDDQGRLIKDLPEDHDLRPVSGGGTSGHHDSSAADRIKP